VNFSSAWRFSVAHTHKLCHTAFICIIRYKINIFALQAFGLWYECLSAFVHPCGAGIRLTILLTHTYCIGLNIKSEALTFELANRLIIFHAHKAHIYLIVSCAKLLYNSMHSSASRPVLTMNHILVIMYSMASPVSFFELLCKETCWYMSGDPTNRQSVVTPAPIHRSHWLQSKGILPVYWPVCKLDLILAFPSALTSITACHLPLFNVECTVIIFQMVASH